MATRLRGLVPGVAALAFAAVAAPAAADEAKERPAATENATNAQLLEALLKRREEVARSAATPDSKKQALEFLDRQIAGLRAEMKS